MWIRTASKDDINAIHDLLVETWHATYDDLIGREEVEKMTAQFHAPELLKKYLSRPSSEYVVADDGETLHGVAYAVQGAVKGDSEIAVLFQLYVKPESQRQGIGQRLLIEIEEAFPAARKIRVNVHQKNERARQFYAMQGYKQLSKIPEHTAPDDVVLEKTLF
ncbi:GNAT family N-acetyltransferase [Bartonella sp. LJL80]